MAQEKCFKPQEPKGFKEDGSTLIMAFNVLVKYVLWLGKHHRSQDNFICECGKTFSPTKIQCPNCHPTGPTKVKRA